MFDPRDIARFTVVTGHYGSGKTNLSINLALDLARTYDEVMLVDLDIVNPYFRSSDYTAMLVEHGVRVISPTFAGTTLDTPSLPGAVGAAFDRKDKAKREELRAARKKAAEEGASTPNR